MNVKVFNFKNIVKVCSKNHWKDDFASILNRERLSPTEQVSFIVISTYASFSRENIFNELNLLPPKTLLIADECHNMASGTLLKLLPKISCKRRIGLFCDTRKGNSMKKEMKNCFLSLILRIDTHMSTQWKML